LYTYFKHYLLFKVLFYLYSHNQNISCQQLDENTEMLQFEALPPWRLFNIQTTTFWCYFGLIQINVTLI